MELLIDFWIKEIIRIITGTTGMLSTVEKANAVSISQSAGVPPERASSHQANDFATWSQWHITEFSNEVLSHIFGCLGCDDIVQVKNTCKPFRQVVLANHWEALSFRQLPELLRKQYLNSRSWQKWLVESKLHPFTTLLPNKLSQIINAEQQAAVVCAHVLGKMESARAYCAKEVFHCQFPTHLMQTECSPTSSDLVLRNTLISKVSLVGQNGSGAWSEQVIDLDQQPHNRSLVGTSFSTDGRYVSIFSLDLIIDIYRRNSECWQWIDQQRLGTAGNFEVSPSGKYLVVLTIEKDIESIRCFDAQEFWQPMPVAEDARIDPSIKRVQFSPTEQHLTIRYEKKLVILSLDSHGCWKVSWATGSDRSICQVEFSPSQRRLLITYLADGDDPGSVEMVRFDPAGQEVSRQTILDRYFQLTFSPAGNYLVSQKDNKQLPLWGLSRNGTLALYGELNDSSKAATSSKCRQMMKDGVWFSSCDHYLMIASRQGAATVWGQDEQGKWTNRGSEKHDGKVNLVEFSQSSVHALSVDPWSIRIWGRGSDDMWSVKGKILATSVMRAHFDPLVEHLIIFNYRHSVRIWEIGKEQSGQEEGAQGGNHFLML